MGSCRIQGVDLGCVRLETGDNTSEEEEEETGQQPFFTSYLEINFNWLILFLKQVG